MNAETLIRALLQVDPNTEVFLVYPGRPTTYYPTGTKTSLYQAHPAAKVHHPAISPECMINRSLKANQYREQQTIFTIEAY